MCMLVIKPIPRVQKFDSEGKFIKMWGKEGSKKGQFVHQHDITVDSKDIRLCY